MGVGIIFEQMVVLVSLMATGFAIRRLKIIDDVANTYLTRLLLGVTLPALLIASALDGGMDMSRGEIPHFFLIITLSFLIMGALSMIAPLALKTKRDERGVFVAMGLFGNASFMGIPLVAAFLPTGMLHAILYNIVFTPPLFSLGMKLIGGKEAKVSAKLFFSPAMVGGLLALLLFLLDIRLPSVLHRSLGLLGGVTTPVAMILLGSVLGEMNLREMLRGWRVYAITAVRLLIAPLGVFFALSPFSIDPMLLQVIVLMSAAPMAVSLAMFTIHYDVHQQIVGKGIFLSTLFSVVTIPLLLFLLL